MGKNYNETLKIYCNLTPLVVGNLRSIQHIWYLPKNGPKIAKKWQKRPKNRKNCKKKRVILHSKICPLEMIFLVCFPTHLLGLSERYVLDPPTLIGDSVFMEIWLKQNRPFSQFSIKISIFSPIKIWSKRSLKIVPKRRLLRKKLIKSSLKNTDRGAFSTYWLWSRCYGSARNFAAKIIKICVFWNFWKNEKWLTLNRKISVTKVWKSKIWDDSFLAFSVGFVVVYSVFSVGAVITEIFADQNRQFCKFPKKTKNGRFRAAKFAP